MRKDGAFRIYKISYEIRRESVVIGGVKESKIEKSIISFSTSAFLLEICFKTPVLHLI